MKLISEVFSNHEELYVIFTSISQRKSLSVSWPHSFPVENPLCTGFYSFYYCSIYNLQFSSSLRESWMYTTQMMTEAGYSTFSAFPSHYFLIFPQKTPLIHFAAAPSCYFLQYLTDIRIFELSGSSEFRNNVLTRRISRKYVPALVRYS